MSTDIMQRSAQVYRIGKGFFWSTLFGSEPGGQPAGRRRGFLSQYVSEGDRWSMLDSGLWIYSDLWWVEREAGCKRWESRVDDGRQEGPSFSAGFWESLGEGVPAQRCCCLNWLCFILAHCSVYYCFVVYWGERPCLHIELRNVLPGLGAVFHTAWLASA